MFRPALAPVECGDRFPPASLARHRATRKPRPSRRAFLAGAAAAILAPHQAFADDAPTINAQIQALPSWGGAIAIDRPMVCSSPVIINKPTVTLRGPVRASGVGGSPGLYFSGGAGIIGRSAGACTIENLAITGSGNKLLDFDGVQTRDTQRLMVRGCLIAGGPQTVLLSIDASDGITIDDNEFSGGTWSIAGRQNFWANGVQITNNEFVNGNGTYISFPGEQWRIVGNIFEPRTDGSQWVISNTPAAPCAALTIADNWIGDTQTPSGNGYIALVNANGVTLRGNLIRGVPGDTVLALYDGCRGIVIQGNDCEGMDCIVDFRGECAGCDISGQSIPIALPEPIRRPENCTWLRTGANSQRLSP